MAQNHSSEKSPMLWTIIPFAVLLTLLFVSVNNNTVAPKAQLAGDFSDVKVELKDTTSGTSPGHCISLRFLIPCWRKRRVWLPKGWDCDLKCGLPAFRVLIAF